MDDKIIEKVNNGKHNGNGYMAWIENSVLDTLVAEIERLQSELDAVNNTADIAEVKRGEWIEIVAPWGGAKGEYQCSVCGCTGQAYKTNYCPNCGTLNKAEGKKEG